MPRRRILRLLAMTLYWDNLLTFRVIASTAGAWQSIFLQSFGPPPLKGRFLHPISKMFDGGVEGTAPYKGFVDSGICRGDHRSSETKSARIRFDGRAMPAPTSPFSFLHRILANAVLNGISVYINIKLCRFLLLCNRELSTLSTGFSTGRHRKTPCKQGVYSHSVRHYPVFSASCGKLFRFTEHC